MTREEFAQVTAYIALGCGRDLSAKAHEVYFDLLRDVPFDVAQVAARRVLVEHKFPTFPTVAELREAAVQCASGEAAELSDGEAWALAWRVSADTDPEIDGSFQRACEKAKAPARVVEAVKAFGLLDLCYGKEPVGVLRGQFLKVYGQLAARDRKLAVLPPAVRSGIEQKRQAVPPPHAHVRALADSFPTPEGTR